MANYFLIPMDFTEYNFEKLRKEWEEHWEIMWQVPGTPIFTSQWEIKEDAKMAKMIKSGDIVYFYVHKLPSGGADTARILLRGVVGEAPHPVPYGKAYLPAKRNPTQMVIALSVKNLTTLCRSERDDNSRYSWETLQNHYGFSAAPQGKFWPNTVDGNLSRKLIEDLEDSFTKTDSMKTLEILGNQWP